MNISHRIANRMDMLSLLCVFLTAMSATGSGVSNDSLNFLAMGDWGGLPFTPFHTAIERSIAKQMSIVASKINAEFLLALGDNFYYDGVKDVQDSRFQETYESIFTDPSLHIPWYVVAGNHDHHGNITAQILYSNISKRWNFTNYWYSKVFPIPGSKRTLRIVMIDTVLLCGMSDVNYNGEQPYGPSNLGLANTQWAWIDGQLRNSKDDYLIVGGHYPVYSIAKHGPTGCLVNQLDAMLHKYNVTAFVSGHDHTLQHLTHADSNYNTKVNYFVIGSANFIEDSNVHKHSVPKHSLKFYWADTDSFGGFAKVRVTSQNMTLTFLRANGVPLYEMSMLPRF